MLQISQNLMLEDGDPVRQNQLNWVWILEEANLEEEFIYNVFLTTVTLYKQVNQTTL